MNIEIEDVKRYVEQEAENVAGVIFSDKVDYDSVWDKARDQCDYRASFPIVGLALVYKYGLDKAVGGAEFEDSPLHQFIDDVTNRAIELLEDEGIEVTY